MANIAKSTEDVTQTSFTEDKPKRHKISLTLTGLTRGDFSGNLNAKQEINAIVVYDFFWGAVLGKEKTEDDVPLYGLTHCSYSYRIYYKLVDGPHISINPEQMGNITHCPISSRNPCHLILPPEYSYFIELANPCHPFIQDKSFARADFLQLCFLGRQYNWDKSRVGSLLKRVSKSLGWRGTEKDFMYKILYMTHHHPPGGTFSEAELFFDEMWDEAESEARSVVEAVGFDWGLNLPG